MANDEFDNSRTDKEILERFKAQTAARNDGAKIDIRTTPNAVAIYLNQPALVDIIDKLQQIQKVCLSTTGVCIMLADHEGTTLLEIGTDDASPKM